MRTRALAHLRTRALAHSRTRACLPGQSSGSRMLNAIGKGAFSVGYALYKTQLGKTLLHDKTCADCANQPPHSSPIMVPLVPGYHVSVLPILHDNYSYLIVDEASHTCLAVDPADARAVAKAIASENLALSGILTTHTHWDHAGGNDELKRMFPDIRVYGSAEDSIPAMTDAVADGEMFWFPSRTVAEDPKLVIEVWETPCHTKGHLVFIVNEKPANGGAAAATGGVAPRPTPIAIFSGDTLFSGGTGKFFEGTAAQMARNLERIAGLPNACKLFCGHEYTLNNFKFAAAVEPDNMLVAERIAAARRLRRDRFPTMPTTVGDEVAANPYMRVVTSRAACGSIAMAMYGITGDMVFRDGRADNVHVLAELRRLRDENLLKVKIEALSHEDT